MVKLVFCVRRLPHLSRERFQRYWWDHHAPLVRRHAATLRIRRYVQMHTLDHPVQAALQASRGGPDAFDGVAEVWWDSAEDLAAATATPEGRAAGAALLADEKTFIDLARSPLFVAEERPVLA
jgi:uncharacterized protein (TIGR02118 family)